MSTRSKTRRTSSTERLKRTERERHGNAATRNRDRRVTSITKSSETRERHEHELDHVDLLLLVLELDRRKAEWADRHACPKPKHPADIVL